MSERQIPKTNLPYRNKIDLFKLRRSRIKEKSKSEKFIEGVGIWASFYRANPHRFVEEYLGIKLKMFQVFLLWAMMHNHYFMFIGARGSGKSFLSAIYVTIRCILYPETKIIITSGVKSQGINVLRKIQDEIRPKSPLVAREIDAIKLGAQDPLISFRNGSWIRVASPNDNARGARANLLLVDEFILVDKDIIDTVFKKMLTSPRHPKFLDKPEYKDRDDLKERNMQMYLSSAGLKSHWSYDSMVAATKQMLNGYNYMVCRIPYYIGIKEDIYDHGQMKEEALLSDFSDMKWAIEMEAQWWGETEEAFFKFSDLDMNRKIDKPFYPRSPLIKGIEKYCSPPEKEPKEKRILSVDVARMAGNANDASVFSLLKLVQKNTRYERQLLYMEDMEGADYETQTIRIRQLFDDFDCDYIVLDIKGVGTGILDNLMRELNDSERGLIYEPFNVMNREDLQENCKKADAPKIIYAISATNEMNLEIANRMANSLKMGQFRLLIPEHLGKEDLITNKQINFEKLPELTKQYLIFPFRQTEYFINEVMNLESKATSSGAFKLTTTGTARKDRYSSVSYGNYFATELERELVNFKRGTDFKSFASFRKPKAII